MITRSPQATQPPLPEVDHYREARQFLEKAANLRIRGDHGREQEAADLAMQANYIAQAHVHALLAQERDMGVETAVDGVRNAVADVIETLHEIRSAIREAGDR